MASNSRDRFTVDKALAVLDDISSSELSDFSTDSEHSEASYLEATTDETSGSEASVNERDGGASGLDSIGIKNNVSEIDGELDNVFAKQGSVKRRQDATNLSIPAKKKVKVVSKKITSPHNVREKGRKITKTPQKVSKHSKWANDENWNNVFTPRNLPNFTGHAGVQVRRGTLPQNLRAIDIFQLFFTVEVWELLVAMTNKYAKSKITQGWKETDVAEMKAFFGLILAMGLLRLPKMKDYWQKTNWVLHVKSFGEIMARNRFMQLYRFLHVADNDKFVPRGDNGYDPLFKIRLFLDILSKQFRNIYKPGQDICIDESLIPYKGRIYFRQFIPSKRARFGVKAFVLSESDTGYVSEIEIYTGKSLDGKVKHDLAETIVESLTEHYTNQGHHLYIDNYYTKVWLLNSLKEKGIYACGTARTDRSGFPKKIAISSKKGKARGYTKWLMNGDILAVSWLDNKGVHFLSSIHDPEYDPSAKDEEKTVKRKGAKGSKEAIEVPCPPCVHPYNKKMGGVDFSDHITKFYNFRRRSRKWYRRVLFHLVELAVHNAFIVEDCFIPHKRNGKLVRKRQAFREELCDQLIGSYRMRSKKVGRPSVAHHSELRFENVGVHIPEYQEKRGECALCKKHVKQQHGGKLTCADKNAKGQSKTFIKCSACYVSLCLNKERNCFAMWHTKV